MIKLFIWVVIYTSILAFSQIILKIGLVKVGSFNIKESKDLFSLGLALLSNPYVLLGTALMASSYFLWLAILSWFKLSVAFPMTALGFIFVALFSYFMLGEKLLLHNYLGIALIAVGIFLLLFKQI
ncbi:MAG: hypothetical protein KJ732_02115 [Candidatus Margulisbacteria bacterium]|nr:hypothetical protein [Candidatus Margulisiibacteriota bacterium]